MNLRVNLFNFRLFDKKTFEFNNNINFITGQNQSGKSTVIESIYVLKTGKSFRVNSLNYCIKYGQNFFSIEGKNDNIEKLIYTDQGSKSYFINENKAKHQIVNNDVFIVYNKNLFNFIFFRDYRRKNIDELISSYDKKYLFYLINYKKIVDKKKEIIYSSIDLNTKKKLYETLIKNISEYTYFIVNKRKNLIKECNQFLMNFCNYKIDYNSRFMDFDENSIQQIYFDSFETEIEQKKYIGPHNDFYVLLDNSMKLVENGASSDFYKFYFYLYLFFIKKIKSEFNVKPIILFDDFFLPLDKDSSRILLSNFDNNDLIIISQHEFFEIGKNDFNIINL